MRRVLIFGILFIILIAILLIYLNYSRQVDMGKLVLSGVIEAEEVDLSFRISGVLNNINFDKGDYVDSGAVAARLEQSELNAALNQAQKNYQASKAAITSVEVNLETVIRNLDKIEKLIPTGAAAQSQYDDLNDKRRQFEAQLDYSRKSLEAAQSSVDMARIRHDYSVLSTSTSGTVLSRMYEPGEVVMPGAPVLTIADLDDLTIRVYLPEIYLGKIKLGQKAAILIDSHPDKTFPGVVVYISDKAEFTPKNIQTKEDRVKQVFAVEISSDSHDGVLKPGLPCDVVITLSDR